VVNRRHSPLKKGSKYFVFFSTFPKKKDAERVAKGLIAKRLAACCNLLPDLTSFFRWEGKQERSKECLLIIKTESRCVKKAEAFLKAHHPYELPEFIGVPVAKGNADYLKWIAQETS